MVKNLSAVKTVLIEELEDMTERLNNATDFTSSALIVGSIQEANHLLRRLFEEFDYECRLYVGKDGLYKCEFKLNEE